ncbi:MAG: enoyl-CoA hydratase/isomerase family protein [Burkholderiaceae bacterium]|nr:enoyl-CoA hydratase/isomerase family protein [Burkholderiaceae bacterium]
MTKTLDIERRGAVTWVWMDRPQTHNAFDADLIEELTQTLQSIDDDDTVRVMVLAGRGKSFSAGADLNWMRSQGAASVEENTRDARKLGDLFMLLGQLSKPVVARVHGAAMGGGMGLAAACTVCVASTSALFATSEVKLGLAPCVISPYVLRAIGARQAQRYFLTAERISAHRAREIGLVHEVAGPDDLDACVQNIVDALLNGGPLAQLASMALIRDVAGLPVSDALVQETAERIARLRATPEAREGLDAFLEKRPAHWQPPTTSGSR